MEALEQRWLEGVAARVPFFRVFNLSGTLWVGLLSDRVGFRPIKVFWVGYVFGLGINFKVRVGLLSGPTHSGQPNPKTQKALSIKNNNNNNNNKKLD
jgi:hypothetical protein